MNKHIKNLIITSLVIVNFGCGMDFKVKGVDKIKAQVDGIPDRLDFGPNIESAAKTCKEFYPNDISKAENCFERYLAFYKLGFDFGGLERYCESQYDETQDVQYNQCVDDLTDLLDRLGWVDGESSGEAQSDESETQGV